METREQHDRETTATAVVEEDCEAGYVLSGGGPVTVEPVAADFAKPFDKQRIAVYFGGASVYVEQRHLPALIAQLLAVQANGPVNA